jgi:hypothetical protein
MSSDWEGPSDLPAKARELRENGVVEMGELINDSILSRINEDYQKIIEDDKYNYTIFEHKGDVYGKGVSTWETDESLIDLIPALTEVINDEVSEVVENYYGTYFKALNVRLYRFDHVPPEIYENAWLNSGGWHQDGHTTDTIKLHMYLHDVDEEDGAYRVIQKPKSEEIVANFDDIGSSWRGLDEEVDSIQIITGEGGTGVITETTKCLHRAANPQPGEHRDMLQFMLVPSSKPVENWESELREHVDGPSRLMKY